MEAIVTKQERTEIKLSEINSYDLPKWQRWKSDINVDSLVDSVSKIKQQRDILICELPNGRRLVTDGNHLRHALIKLGYKKANVTINCVETEIDAFKLFIEFNTKGNTLKNLDYIVSWSNFTNDNPYKKFLYEVLDNPRNAKEAKASATKHKVFTFTVIN